MSEQEENTIDIYLERHSLYDLDGKYGEDTYVLNFNFGYKPVAVRELVFQDLENLYGLLERVIKAEKECRAIVDKSVKDITFTEE